MVAAGCWWRTEDWGAGSAPTSTTASAGRRWPAAKRASTCTLSESSRSSAMPLPSRMRAWCCPAMRVGSACGEAGIVPDSTIPARIIPHARHDMTDHDTAADTTAIEADAFRRLLQHLARDRADVQNIDLMTGAEIG